MTDELDDYGDQYDLATFLRRVLSVLDPPLRRRQIERHLLTVDAPTVAAHLQAILVRAVQGDPDCQTLMFPLIAFVQSAEATEHLALDAIDLAARQAGYAALAWFLLDPPAARVIDARQLSRMNSAVSESLGFRRSQAMRPEPAILERLTWDDHPMVIDRLCQNPRVTEAHILSVVTRRPTIPELLGTVAAHARWIQRAKVREGIVNNPFGPTGLALRLLPTLGLRAWESIRHAGQVHPSVVAFAEHLIAVRYGEVPAAMPELERQVEE